MREPGFKGQRAGKANILNLKKLIVPLGNEAGKTNTRRGAWRPWDNHMRDLSA